MTVVIILVILFLIGAVLFVTKQDKPAPTIGGGGYSGGSDTHQHISHIDNGEVPVNKENPRHDG